MSYFKILFTRSSKTLKILGKKFNRICARNLHFKPQIIAEKKLKEINYVLTVCLSKIHMLELKLQGNDIKRLDIWEND
jgi:hypothetical protein